MRMLTGLVAAVVLVETTVSAQTLSPRFTRPTVPSRTALDRLHLHLGWSTFLPVDGKRDGPFTLQVLDDLVLVQLYSGSIIALDAETGVRRWRTDVGLPYRTAFEAGFNGKSIFVVNGPRLYGLDRATGKTQWEYDLPTAPTAAPAADEERVYLCLGGGRFSTYKLVGIEKTKNGVQVTTAAKPKDFARYDLGGSSVNTIGQMSGVANGRVGRGNGLVPVTLASHPTGVLLDQPPMVGDSMVMVAGGTGRFFASRKSGLGALSWFPTPMPLSAPLGVNGQYVYVPAKDSNLYALHLDTARVQWVDTGSGRPVVRKPGVTDSDVFVVRERLGLQRLDRASGREVWNNPDGDRFLAANSRFVYALDRKGHLLVLDRQRGTGLSSLNTHEFQAPFVNERTDRIFLAANDGLLICLHDRDLTRPVRMKTLPSDKKPEVKPPADKAIAANPAMKTG